MNPFGKGVKSFLVQRGYTYKGAFWKYLPERSLLSEVSFRPVKPAFGEVEVLGYAIALHVYYPVFDRFLLVSPAEMTDLRRDGTLKHVVYVTEHEGIFLKTEADIVESVLGEWFDYWHERMTDPRYALEAIEALRGRAPFPAHLTYLTDFVAKDDEDKLRFEVQRVACVFPFDGGINFSSYVAYLNAAGRFAEASRLIESARDERFFHGVRHAPVVLQGSLKKLADDASQHRIALSESNMRELTRLGQWGRESG
jgi:hypothetical protein